MRLRNKFPEVSALLMLVVLVWMCVAAASDAPRLGCCTQVKILRPAIMRSIHMLGPKHPAGVQLELAMRDAYGPCVWRGEAFQCQD